MGVNRRFFGAGACGIVRFSSIGSKRLLRLIRGREGDCVQDIEAHGLFLGCQVRVNIQRHFDALVPEAVLHVLQRGAVGEAAAQPGVPELVG